MVAWGATLSHFFWSKVLGAKLLYLRSLWKTWYFHSIWLCLRAYGVCIDTDIETVYVVVLSFYSRFVVFIAFLVLHVFSYLCVLVLFSSFEMCSCPAYEGPALDLLTFLTFLFVVINFWSFALKLSMLQRFSLCDTSYAGISDFSGAPNIFFFCKITVRRSKYFLEVSKPREKRKLSGYTFQFRPSCSEFFY